MTSVRRPTGIRREWVLPEICAFATYNFETLRRNLALLILKDYHNEKIEVSIESMLINMNSKFQD